MNHLIPMRGDMKLWLVARPAANVGYDEHDSFVVRAIDGLAARIIAARASYGFDREFLDSQRSTCTEITSDGDEAVVLASFNAG